MLRQSIEGLSLLILRPLLAAVFVLVLSLAGPLHGGASSPEGTAVAANAHGAGHGHADRAEVTTDHHTDRTDDGGCKDGNCAGCALHCSLIALVDSAVVLAFDAPAQTFAIASESGSIGMAATVERPPESV